MIVTPNPARLRVLRLLAAPDAAIHVPDRPTGAYPLCINGHLVTLVRRPTMKALVDNVWVHWDEPRQRWVIGHTGRAHAEVQAFVRAFAADPRNVEDRG